MVLSNELSCEAGNFSHCHNPHRFLQPEVLRLYFPPLEPWVVWCVSLSCCSSQFIHMQIWDCPVHQPPLFYVSSPPQLTVSILPTSLDECFFINSSFVGIPHKSIFRQFWIFFVLKFVVVLLLVVRGGKVYLPMPPSWPEVCTCHSCGPAWCIAAMLVGHVSVSKAPTQANLDHVQLHYVHKKCICSYSELGPLLGT